MGRPMLTGKIINQIREMKHKGATIGGIAEILNMSTRTVQKYLKTELKEPSTALLMDEIKALKSIIGEMQSTIKQQGERIKVLGESTPDTVKDKEFISTRLIPSESTKLVPEISTRFVPDAELVKVNPIKGKELDFPELDKITENNEKAMKKFLEDKTDPLDVAEDTTLKGYYTVKEAEAVTGNKARYLQKKLQALGYEKVKGHYRIPVKDIGRFKRQRKHKRIES